jgi:Ca-activated chloride channel family protein
MRWESPWWLLALLVVPIGVALARRGAARPAAVLWSVAPARRASWRGALRALVAALPWLALILAVAALARPQRGVSQSETSTRGVDIELAIDISPSMAAQDFAPRNRLTVAKETARAFVRQRPHDRLGLVAVAAPAVTHGALTQVHDALVELLESLDFGMAEDGTAIGMGLATAVSGLRESHTPSRVVVLLTDGENNRGAIDPATAADLAHALGIRVYAILVGRGGVVPVPVDDPLLGQRIQMVRMDVDETSLREIATRTGGRFFRAQDPATLAQVYDLIDKLERAPIHSIEYREYRDLGPLFLGAALALVLLYALGVSTFAFRLP